MLKAGGVEVETPADPRLESADDALMVGDLDAAEAAYKKILFEAPADAAAEAGLAQVGLFRRVQGVDAAKALTDASAAADDIPAQLLAADVEVLGGEADRAYKRLVDLVRRSVGDDKETVRIAPGVVVHDRRTRRPGGRGGPPGPGQRAVLSR